MGSLECELHTDGHGLAWARKAQVIRQDLCDSLQLDQDKMALLVDQNNIGIDLLANDRPEEALLILQEVHASDMASGGISVSNWYRTINLSLCNRILGRYDEAMRYSNIATEVIREHIGQDGVPMATQVALVLSAWLVFLLTTCLPTGRSSFSGTCSYVWAIGLRRLRHSRNASGFDKS